MSYGRENLSFPLIMKWFVMKILLTRVLFILAIHGSLGFVVVRSPLLPLSTRKNKATVSARKTSANTLTGRSILKVHDLLETNDNRPYEQRVDGPRVARRLNHAFKYLYRSNATDFLDTTSFEYLSQFYSEDQLLAMNATFPPLLDLNVSRHLLPKIRFLQHTMGISTAQLANSRIPPQYFGARLERTIAPRHAFLVFKKLPHGKELMKIKKQSQGDTSSMWEDFLLACRKTKRFCALCNQWRAAGEPLITAKEVEAFDTLFGRGIMAAARNDLVQYNNTWARDNLNITAAELVELLIRHGANPLERDNRGVSLLHWAAGSGNLEAVKVLLPHFPRGLQEPAERDGATPLHWAAAGVNPKEFGTGGHEDVCRYILAKGGSVDNVSSKELVNKLTFDGNSPLMWASWSGTLETVKLMIRNRADPLVANRNGCTAAHWAASGGNLEVCKYLADVVGIDFFAPNHGGNTPLTHAVAYGRADVVQFLLERRGNGDVKDDDIAASLAQDFVDWGTGNDQKKRKQVLQLFRDDYWLDEESDGVADGSSIIDLNKAQLEEFQGL